MTQREAKLEVVDFEKNPMISSNVFMLKIPRMMVTSRVLIMEYLIQEKTQSGDSRAPPGRFLFLHAAAISAGVCCNKTNNVANPKARSISLISSAESIPIIIDMPDQKLYLSVSPVIKMKIIATTNIKTTIAI